MLTKVTLLGLLGLLGVVESHVRLMHPTSRSSLWRLEEFQQFNPPENYNDDGLYCGRVHQWPEVDNCGLCGDPVSDPVPRDNEHGGTYGLGIVAGTYKSGQVLTIELDFGPTHSGHVEFHLCEGLPETDECFMKNVLQLEGGGGSEFPIDEDGAVVHKSVNVQLPLGLVCEHCILRMNYRAGNNWGDCRNGTEGMGCGLQETFRHCSDIVIN